MITSHSHNHVLSSFAKLARKIMDLHTKASFPSDSDNTKNNNLRSREFKQKFNILSVVVPVYNEKKTLQDVLKRIAAVPLDKEIILVDDGSTDGTRDLLTTLEAQKPEFERLSGHRFDIRIFFNEKNQGKGASVRTGIQKATGGLLIIQDADMEYDPQDYLTLIEPFLTQNIDVVYGSRFARAQGWQRWRLHTMANRFLTFWSNVFTKLHLTDMETCYKVFKTDLIKAIPLKSNRFGIEPEVTAKIARLKYRVVERPISYRGRGYSEGKKITWKDGLVALWCIVKYAYSNDLKAHENN